MDNTCAWNVSKMVDREINNAYYIFESLTKKPQDYLSYQENIIDRVKGLVKNLYDTTKYSERKIAQNTALPELIVDSFDEEQIWQELELQNNDWNNNFNSEVSKFIEKKDSVLFPINISNTEDEDTDNPTFDDVKLKETENRNAGGICSGNSNFDEIDAIDFEDDSDVGSGSEYSISSVTKHEVIGNLDQMSEKSKVKIQERQKVSEVDDKFFKLSEMERFVEIEEQKDQKVSSINNFHDGDSDVNYFADNLEDEGYGMETQKGGADYKYDDFFAPPEDLNKIEVEHVRPESDDAESYTGDNINTDISDSIDDSEDGKTKETKSSFEERQERLQNKIKKLEEEALQEKPWQLSGEVGGSARPQNSLLEEFVDFDVTTRPAPIITEETTMRLEDIILLRIKDKSWDDVERKFKPLDTPELFKKPYVLDQEKSKLSLAEVYEQEYLKQRDSIVTNEDKYNEKKEIEPQIHSEVQAMMSSLFNKLDALSNFHYTPRPVIPELKIVSNIPAINMEEVAPVAASNAMLLAPEEIQGKSFKILVNKSEQTVTDKKRALRNKKKKQKKRAREMMKKNLSIVDKKRSSNSDKLKMKKSENKGDASHSSKKFFSSLQEVNNNIKRKAKCIDR